MAFVLAREVLPEHSSRFSRKDFTLAQLFACLVVRQCLNLSYRRIEALLKATDWCQRLGMKSVPDHSTLCRAFERIITLARTEDLLDLIVRHMQRTGSLGKSSAMDSTLCEPHHRSRHYDRRCRDSACRRNTANARRSRAARRMPKLAFAADTRSHLILSAKVRIGMASDAPDFDDLLYDAWCRHPVKQVLADAGYDSEANHRVARLDLGVQSLIQTGVGRPTQKSPSGYYRRLMQRQLCGSQKGRPYGQRAQAETVVSMIKRLQGESLRSRSIQNRRKELQLKVLTHDVMIFRRPSRVATEPA